MPSYEPSVVVADESPLLRAGLTDLLARGGYQVVADAGDAEALIQAATDTLPTLVVTAARLGVTSGPGDEGITAAIRLHEKVPEMGIVVLADSVEAAYAAPVFASTGTGGLGYLRKSRVRTVPHFLDVLGRVASGEVVVDPEVITRMVDASPDADAEAMARLTMQQSEVLGLIHAGFPDRAIISRLFGGRGEFELCLSEMFLAFGLAADVEHRRTPTPLTHLATG
ncbi:DNA-binding NarL/FixJ family response regulator [Nocardioides luteus]|uniref:DNA-binding response regulator n=1 Tax=Nocardioides luteus TaxID=1844 RepID=A0ABQ5SYH9_9ACTN|nr:response regulator transcription factor [Nocardioides luteus]MDR7310983.1 DNA-binding NarL/FixJ family response regulator [Nocardioides luteus]GGR39367.1 DNA-binding response regulator [Nocardioides luteus]GLJ69237.1 DNA-binding response regulator [Nocardioides luteus]